MAVVKVARLRVLEYDLPLKRPLRIRNRALTRRTGIILEMQSDSGAVGYGEAAPLSGSSLESVDAVAEVALRFGRSLQGCIIPPQLNSLTDRFERWIGAHELPPSLRFGVEMAVLDLLAAANRRSLGCLCSGVTPPPIPLNGLLAGERDEVLAQAETLVRQGYTCLKLKVGRENPRPEAETVRALRACVGPDVALRLDANRAWDFDAAAAFGRAVADSRIEYIEEPVDDVSRLVNFAGVTGVPVAIDETVLESGFEDLERWRGVRAIVLKPTLLGGGEATMTLARRARNLNMTPVIGSSFESGLGLQALAALAACIEGEPAAAGLDTWRWFAEDVLNAPLPIREGALDVARPVVGLRPELLREVTFA